MSTVTIIIGKQGTGKTTKALELCKGKSNIWINSLRYISFKELFLDYEVVVIESLSNDYDLKKLKELINTPFLNIRKPYTEKAVPVQRPEIIITTNDTLNENDFADVSNVKFIHLVNIF